MSRVLKIGSKFLDLILIRLKVKQPMGDLKKMRLFILSCIFYVPAVILEETICRNIWFGVNIFPTKFHEDILYDIEIM